MKILNNSILLICFSLLISSCIKDHCSRKVRMYIPIYKTREAVLSHVKLLPAKAMTKPGKIFSYGNYLLINEIDKGIHIIDNSTPASPVKLGFLNIDGNLDLWVKNNLLYADCYDNLLVLNISDIHNIRLVESVNKVFPDRSYIGAVIDDTKGYIIGWEQKDTTMTIDCNDQVNYTPLYYSKRVAYSMDLGISSSSGFTPPSGVAGSLTRFNATGDYLYCVGSFTLHTFNISQQKPVKTSNLSITWDVETIYSFNNNLFIGTNSGVLIYSLSNPSSPSYLNKMEHVRTCDPVITDGQNAFVTLRGGAPCGGYSNQLDVLNVSNLQSVTLVKSYLLNSPYGLGMDLQYLYICDDGYGIRVYNRNDVSKMVEVSKITMDHPRDIIVLDHSLLVISDTNFIQYDASDINNIKQISILN